MVMILCVMRRWDGIAVNFFLFLREIPLFRIGFLARKGESWQLWIAPIQNSSRSLQARSSIIFPQPSFLFPFHLRLDTLRLQRMLIHRWVEGWGVPRFPCPLGKELYQWACLVIAFRASSDSSGEAPREACSPCPAAQSRRGDTWGTYRAYILYGGQPDQPLVEGISSFLVSKPLCITSNLGACFTLSCV